jgi:hypothetical protein
MQFLSSLEQIFPSLAGHVAFMGDFNLLRAPRDKSNNNLILLKLLPSTTSLMALVCWKSLSWIASSLGLTNRCHRSLRAWTGF